MTIITTAIGLILVYLILSLIVTAIQEAIASWLSLRGRHLGQALDQMLTNEQTSEQGLALDKSLLEKFKNHTSFRQLVDKKTKPGETPSAYPSYMSSTAFANILFHVLDGTDVQKLTAAIQTMEDGRLKTFLQETLQSANNDLAAFRKEIERWYDRVMSRVTGWYKRYVHKIIMVIGLLLAVYMNADTLSIYEKMSEVATGSPQEQAINTLAQSFVDSRYASFQQQLTIVKQNLDSAATQVDSAQYANQLLAHNQQLLGQVDSLLVGTVGPASPLGLGWTQAEWTEVKTGGFMGIVNKLLGLLITAFAISLGAPFWFDMLKKIINVRNAGPVHENSKE